MNKLLARIVAISAGSLMVLQFAVVPSLVHARPSIPVAYVDDSADPMCDGESAALSTDTDGHCAYQTISQGINAVATDGSGVVNVAAGDYDLSSELEIDYPMTIVGAGQGITNVYNDTGYNDAMVRINASNVTIKNFTFDQDQDVSYPVLRVGNEVTGVTIDNNELVDGYAGVGFAAASYGNTVSNNNIYGYYSGVTFGGSYNNQVLNNHIYDSRYGVWFRASSYYGDDRDENVDGNLIQGNMIENSSEGIVIDLQANGTKIVGNTFKNIIEPVSAIHIDDDQTNLTIAYNKFADNSCSLSVDGSVSTAINATLNWWDTADGPDSSNSGCPENGIDDPNSLVTYEPFLTKEAYATLDPITEVITDIGELGKSGLADSSGDPTATPSVTFIHDITLSVATTGGTSTISFEEGTVVTKTDGGNFDATALTASGVTSGTLSGFVTGTVVNGAFQWGIPQIGLTFNPAITLHIFVGANLNGKTLNVQRSVSGSSGWTNDGIVEPKTCVVTDGYCTFQATKASYYAATSLTGTLPVTGIKAKLGEYLGI